MNFTSHSDKLTSYTSTVWVQSSCCPSVRYETQRMSLARRIELTRAVRDLWNQQQFHDAGTGTTDRLESALLGSEIDRIYLRWGLLQVEGLQIDGETATAESLVEKGPEVLCREIVEHIKNDCGLTEAERKN
jgi:hypothetical protein